MIELLAPAKNREAGILAVNCGADALYIGASAFGARAEARNSLQEIEALVNYAHLYRVKVYATLNTLVYESELTTAEQLVNSLYQVGVDALIIQDMAFLQLQLPPIPLFASTQTDNSSVEKVRFLEQVGFQRAILARELSLQEIAAIRQQTTIHLETFVHGALCVSYSGQCFLSRAYGKRSGNRGDCGQPCRTRFSLQDENGKIITPESHLLSLKDLNLSQHIDALIDAGVSSLKIEGRLKDVAYLKNCVLHYRQLLDQTLAKRSMQRSSSGIVHCDFSPDLNKTFNRGYCDYFIQGQPRAITSWETPKWLGEPIGIVAQIDSSSIALTHLPDTPLPKLSPGDGVAFFDSQNRLQGSSVNAVKQDKIELENLADISIGNMVFRNRDHLFLRALESANPQRKIPLQFSLTATLSGYRLAAKDEDGIEVEKTVALTNQLAQQPEKFLQTLIQQLKKSGNTPFEVTNVVIEKTDYPLQFLPVSSINALRREVLELLSAKRLQAAATDWRETAPLSPNAAFKTPAVKDSSNKPATPSMTANEWNITNSLAEKFYQEHGITPSKLSLESRQAQKGDTVMTCRYCILREIGRCLKHTPSQTTYFLVDTQGRKFRLQFDCAACQMQLIIA